MKAKSALRSFLALASSSLIAVSSAHAATGTWVPTATGTYSWNSNPNWTASPFPNGAGETANLNNNIAGVQTINLNQNITVGILNFGDSGGIPVAITLASGTGTNSLIFNNSGSDALLTRGSGLASVRDIINPNITLNDNLVINNTSTGGNNNLALELAGQITGNKSITLQGIGVTGLLNTTNTYSGGLTLDGGVVMTTNNRNAFGTGALTITSNGGTVLTSANGAAAQLLVTENANAWNGNLNVAGAMWNNNGNVTLGNNVTVTSTNSVYLGLGGNIGETGGARSLTFSGGGAATITTLAGTNTYTGGTTVNGGRVNFLKTASMPSTGSVTFATGAALGIGLGGTGGWTSTGTGAGTLAGIFDGVNVGVGAGGVALSYGAAVGLNLIVTGTHSFGAISNLGSGNTNFIQSGIGSLTMTGDNTYVGTTTLMGGGTMILDYATTAASKLPGTTQNAFFGFVPAGQQPHQGYGGGTITLKGGSFTEGLGSATLYAGGTFITRDGGTSKLRLNGISRNAGSSISFADATIADTDANNFGTSGANGILGGWATVGNDWAVSANTGAADTIITALASYTPFVNTGGVATTNYSLGGTDALTGATAVGSLKITDSGSGQSLTLGAYNLNITSTSATALGGIMYAGGTTGSYTIAGGGAGRLGTSTAGQELIFAVQSGTLNVNAIFAGSNAITKTGAGTMEIGATNTGNGTYYVNQGVLRLANAAASGGASSFGGTGIFVQNSAALELTGGLSFTSGERIMITGSGVSNGGALRSVSGANTWRGLVDIGIGGARINNDDTGNLFTLTAGIATVGGGDVTFGGAGNTTVSTAAIYGAGGLIKDGAGTLTLSAANTYIGATIVKAGKLTLNTATTVSSSSSIVAGDTGSSGAILDVTAAGLTVGANQTLAGIGTVLATGKTVTVNSGGKLAAGDGGVGALAISGGSLAMSSGSIFDWDINTTANTSDSVGVGGTLSVTSGAIFKVVSSTAFTNAFWDTTRSWSVFGGKDFSAFTLNFLANNVSQVAGDFATEGSFTFTSGGTNLTWTAVPEPSSVLAGLLLTAGLLRRRRTA